MHTSKDLKEASTYVSPYPDHLPYIANPIQVGGWLRRCCQRCRGRAIRLVLPGTRRPRQLAYSRLHTRPRFRLERLRNIDALHLPYTRIRLQRLLHRRNGQGLRQNHGPEEVHSLQQQLAQPLQRKPDLSLVERHRHRLHWLF